MARHYGLHRLARCYCRCCDRTWFPLYIFTTLQGTEERANSQQNHHTALFEWYIPAHCAFEVVQMIRKGALILATAIPYNRVLPEDFMIGGWGRL